MGQASCKVACDKYSEHLERTGQLHRQRGRESEERWYQRVDVDNTGCRKFLGLPEAGVHPRLLFTETEVPSLLARYTCSDGIGSLLRKNLDMSYQDYQKRRSQTALLSPEERSRPGKETVELFLGADPSRNDAWLLTFVKGFLSDDLDLMNEVQSEVLFHARLVLACAELARSEGLKGKPFNLFQDNGFNVDHAFTLGGASFALCYDIMASRMTGEEASVVRKSLSVATKGRRSWGMGLPARRVQSNWSGYHGDLLAMACVIEGEEGHDEKVVEIFSELMLNYANHGFFNSGHPVEDAYALNVGLREGSISLIALARRGLNLFRHPNIQQVWRHWMPLALHPDSSGCIYGGPSGSDLIYCTSVVVAKYMYPKDAIVDFVYRHYMCEGGKNYSRINKLQTRGHCAIFALPAHDECMADEHVHSLGVEQPLTFHCRDRGKVIMRSDWSPSAMWFTLDTCASAFLIGHDAPSRGSFVLSALGRNWSKSPEWRFFQASTDYSVPSIDGQGQGVKAPSVKLINCIDGGLGNTTYTSADLTYCYNYEWTVWAKKCEEEKYMLAGWEHEPNSPQDFGMTAYWLPDKLYDEPNVAFQGLHQLRRRFNTVKKITRSFLMVRDSPIPFAVLADDCVKGDGTKHEYSWAMAVDHDIKLLSFDGRDVVLEETCPNSDRRLVLRILTAYGGSEIECNLEKYLKDNTRKKLPDGSCEQIEAFRLTLKTTSVDAHFNIAFFPLKDSESLPPTTTWTDSRHLLVESQGSSDASIPTVHIIEYGDAPGSHDVA